VYEKQSRAKRAVAEGYEARGMRTKGWWGFQLQSLSLFKLIRVRFELFANSNANACDWTISVNKIWIAHLLSETTRRPYLKIRDEACRGPKGRDNDAN
jgi:hypothetical protein